jgi:catechol 2,3-dioxygenase-like lactoylglutathione lyase family enzyme
MPQDAVILSGISTVAIAVADQDATVRLFEQLGFEKRFDADVNIGFRWIDMAAPDGETGLSVIATTDQLPTGIDTGIRFVTPDARAAHVSMAALGLKVSDLLDWPTAPLMFEFWDLDGNTMYVAEADQVAG